MSFDQPPHMRVEQMLAQRGGGWPGQTDADHRVEMSVPGLVEPAPMRAHVALQGAACQVFDPFVEQRQVEQTLARGFKVVVAAQELPVGAVGQVQQGHAADLFFNKGHA